jgi:hypothetical protein
MAKHWRLGISLAAFAYRDCSLVGFRNIYTNGGHIKVNYLGPKAFQYHIFTYPAGLVRVLVS